MNKFWNKLIALAIWYVVWIVLLLIFAYFIGWDGISQITIGVVPAILAILCITPLPAKFFKWLWEKIKVGVKNLFKKNA